MKEHWRPIDVQADVIIDQRDILDEAKRNRERIAQAIDQPMIRTTIIQNPRGLYQKEARHSYRIPIEKKRPPRKKRI